MDFGCLFSILNTNRNQEIWEVIKLDNLNNKRSIYIDMALEIMTKDWFQLLWAWENPLAKLDKRLWNYDANICVFKKIKKFTVDKVQ